jgi:hypothetical protein
LHRAVTLSFQDDLVGTVAKSVDGGRPKDPVREGIGPFRDVHVGGDDGALALVAFGDQVVDFALRDEIDESVNLKIIWLA